MKLSVVIPAHNEEGCIEGTLVNLHKELKAAGISHELLVINDNSRDSTEEILLRLQRTIPELRYINNRPPNGFGFAVRCGLENFEGDAVAVYMADASDEPKDLVKFFKTMEQENVDCVFGNRWSKTSRVTEYPYGKLLLNRVVNFFIRVLFGLRYSDVTNAFKLYKRSVIVGVQPFLSHHFNLTVELPLKAIIRGYSFTIVPNNWIGRKAGISKLKLKEMGSRYLFIILYCMIEKLFSMGDYKQVKIHGNSANRLGKKIETTAS